MRGKDKDKCSGNSGFVIPVCPSPLTLFALGDCWEFALLVSLHWLYCQLGQRLAVQGNQFTWH